ncbi:hypothetical protein ACN469_07760 [Corallococcus terminator]
MGHTRIKQCLLASVLLTQVTTGCGTTEQDEPLSHQSAALPGDVQKVTGDTPCPTGYAIATLNDVLASQNAVCGLLDTWDIARLDGSGALRGSGYGCGVNAVELNSLGHTVCKQTSSSTFLKVVGDGPCAPGQTLLSPSEARTRSAEVCAKLATWDIARLSGGGTIHGPGYGCIIRDVDPQGVGHALCKSLN